MNISPILFFSLCLHSPPLDITTSELTHSNGKYSCFSIPPDRFYMDYEPANSILQLASPLPRYGAIMTAVSGNGLISYHLSLEDYRVVLRVQEGDNTSDNSTIVQLSSSRDYQIQFSRGSTTIEVEITTIDSPVTSHMLTITFPPSALEFDAGYVCLGGSQLETPTYQGAMRAAHFKQYSLSALSHVVLFPHQLVSDSDVINFLPGSRHPLSFTRHSLSSRRIELEVRTNRTSWLVFYSEAMSSGQSFALSLLNDEILLLVVPGKGTVPVVEDCGMTSISDGKWHSIALEKVRDSATPGIRVVVDSTVICSLENTVIDSTVAALSSEPLNIGHTERGSFGVGVPFVGCLQKIRFSNGATTFQPNLEAVIRTEEHFSATGCYYCDAEDEREAECDGVCLNVGSEELQCCPTREICGKYCIDLM